MQPMLVLNSPRSCFRLLSAGIAGEYDLMPGPSLLDCIYWLLLLYVY